MSEGDVKDYSSSPDISITIYFLFLFWIIDSLEVAKNV